MLELLVLLLESLADAGSTSSLLTCGADAVTAVGSAAVAVVVLGMSPVGRMPAPRGREMLC